MTREVRALIRECDAYKNCKYNREPPPGLLQPLLIHDDMWQEVSMNFIKGLPRSLGNSVIMVVVDRFSKYAHFTVLQHPFTAAIVAYAYIDNIYKLHILPKVIISNRDNIFLSNFWHKFFKLLGVELHYSTAYHPQSDGQTKVVNRCLETYLRCMTGECPIKWANWLSLAEFLYNTNYHIALKTTPIQVVYGYPPPLHIPYIPRDSSLPAVDQRMRDKNRMIRVLKDNLHKAQ